MNQKRTAPALLMPAGSFDALRAAVAGGADEVYLGGRMANARMRAKNFSDEELRRGVGLCHEAGVRVYVTVNTLVLDREMEDVLQYVLFLYKTQVDGLIVADLGLAARIHELLPDFPLHASTQAGGHSLACAEDFAQRGFSRMVASRELNYTQIRELAEHSPIPIEIFIHGAHCVSCSGQCLLSAVMGGRSGNRGSCAQPCRLPYNGGYPLSLKDMCLAGHITDILDTKVASLKVEGRMKPAEYVYGVARIYRRLLDERRNATPKEWEALQALFSRTGFTDGYFTGKIGKGMGGIRREEDKKASGAPMKMKPCGRVLPSIAERPERAEEISPPAYKRPVPAKPVRREDMKKSAFFLQSEQVCGQDYFDEIYLPLHCFDPQKANGIALPPVICDDEAEAVREKLARARRQGADHLLIAHPGQLSLAEGLGYRLHGDFRLNLTNSESVQTIPELEDVLLSPELTLPQIRDIAGEKAVIAYGRLPLMVLTRRIGVPALKDRKGVSFPVVPYDRSEWVLNSVPIYMGDAQEKLAKAGVKKMHFLFTVESPAECRKTIIDYQKEKARAGALKRIRG